MDETTPATDRPTLTTDERRAILAEYDSYVRGDPRRGALLRQHGLYTSQLAKWRQRVKRGTTSLDAQRPGPVPQPRNPLADEVSRLTRENARLQAKLAQATVIMDVQKKWPHCLGWCQPQRRTPNYDGQRARIDPHDWRWPGLYRARCAPQHHLPSSAPRASTAFHRASTASACAQPG